MSTFSEDANMGLTALINGLDYESEHPEPRSTPPRASNKNARSTSRDTPALPDLGTAIVAQIGNPHDRDPATGTHPEIVAYLIAINRTRLVCESSDGRRHIVPISSFIRVHDGPIGRRLSASERRLREDIRNVGRAGKGSRDNPVGAALVIQGPSVLPALLDELAAAYDRVEHEPVGASGGLFREYVGIVSKQRVYDRALLKRIPIVVAAIINASPDPRTLLARIRAVPIERVRTTCYDAAMALLEPAYARKRVRPESPPEATAGKDTLVLIEVGPRKIDVIRVIRELKRVDLSTATNLTEAPPRAICDGVDELWANYAALLLRNVGARVQIRR